MKTSPAEGRRRLQKNTDYIVFFCACSPQTDIFFGRRGGEGVQITNLPKPPIHHWNLCVMVGPRRVVGPEGGEVKCLGVQVCKNTAYARVGV